MVQRGFITPPLHVGPLRLRFAFHSLSPQKGPIPGLGALYSSYQAPLSPAVDITRAIDELFFSPPEKSLPAILWFDVRKRRSSLFIRRLEKSLSLLPIRFCPPATNWSNRGFCRAPPSIGHYCFHLRNLSIPCALSGSSFLQEGMRFVLNTLLQGRPRAMLLRYGWDFGGDPCLIVFLEDPLFRQQRSFLGTANQGSPSPYKLAALQRYFFQPLFSEVLASCSRQTSS